MGVPVISLAGDSHASRVGKSLLEHNKLNDLVVNSIDQYISSIVALASNIELLEHLKSNLRPHLSHSPLTNAGQFTKTLEATYLEIWKNRLNS